MSYVRTLLIVFEYYLRELNIDLIELEITATSSWSICFCFHISFCTHTLILKTSYFFLFFKGYTENLFSEVSQRALISKFGLQ